MLSTTVTELPELGAVYETNLNGLMVLWCLRIVETQWATNYEFMILDGKNDSGNLFRSWTMPKTTAARACTLRYNDFTILDAMRSFAFKRIA